MCNLLLSAVMPFARPRIEFNQLLAALTLWRVSSLTIFLVSNFSSRSMAFSFFALDLADDMLPRCLPFFTTVADFCGGGM